MHTAVQLCTAVMFVYGVQSVLCCTEIHVQQDSVAGKVAYHLHRNLILEQQVYEKKHRKRIQLRGVLL